MEIFETMHSIDVYRKTLTKTTEIQTGDQIRVGHYTATCQTVTPKGALFLLDQYLDEAYPMNRKNTNKGGYEESDLRETLRSKEILDLFDDWGDRMVPFDNGDLLRIPFFGEIFGQEDAEYFEPDGCEQWELMKDRKNRIAAEYAAALAMCSCGFTAGYENGAAHIREILGGKPEAPQASLLMSAFGSGDKAASLIMGDNA